MAAPKAVQTIRIQQADLVTANANRDGTGTLVSVFTGAAAPGSVVFWVDIAAVAATAIGNIKFFHYDGSNNQYMGEISVNATPTPDASTKPWQYHGPLPFGPLELPTASHVLKMCAETGDDFNVVAKGGDYA